MTENRFKIIIGEFEEENICDTVKHIKITKISDMCTQMNDLSIENEQLKQFQNNVAEVINNKMEDNASNDYKMEVLKEIWEELKLDELSDDNNQLKKDIEEHNIDERLFDDLYFNQVEGI